MVIGLGWAKDGGFDALEDGADLFDFQEVAGEDVGDERADGDDAEFGENDEDGVVGGHEGEEFGERVGDAGGDESGKKSAEGVGPKGAVKEAAFGATIEEGEEKDDFEESADGLGPAETVGATAEQGEADGDEDGDTDSDERDDEGGFGVLASVEAAGGDVENGAGEDGNDEGAEDGGDCGVAAVFNETYDVAASEEGDGGNWKGDPDDGAEGGTEGLVEFGLLPFPDFLGELGEEGGGDGDADEVNWHGREVVSLLVGTKSAGAHAGRKVGGDDGVEVIHALVE